jgi:hypothetical protein
MSAASWLAPRGELHRSRPPEDVDGQLQPRVGVDVLGKSDDDDHALIRFDPQAAACIDHHGIRRRPQGQRQGLLGAHAPS